MGTDLTLECNGPAWQCCHSALYCCHLLNFTSVFFSNLLKIASVSPSQSKRKKMWVAQMSKVGKQTRNLTTLSPTVLACRDFKSERCCYILRTKKSVLQETFCAIISCISWRKVHMTATWVLTMSGSKITCGTYCKEMGDEWLLMWWKLMSEEMWSKIISLCLSYRHRGNYSLQHCLLIDGNRSLQQVVKNLSKINKTLSHLAAVLWAALQGISSSYSKARTI